MEKKMAIDAIMSSGAYASSGSAANLVRWEMEYKFPQGELVFTDVALHHMHKYESWMQQYKDMPVSALRETIKGVALANLQMAVAYALGHPRLDPHFASNQLHKLTALEKDIESALKLNAVLH